MALAPVYGPGCAAPEYRQFDFWVGEWEVVVPFAPAGTPNSASIIRSELDGCMVEENWFGGGFGAFSVAGRSLNMYDFSTGQWHQHWINSPGGAASVELYAGGIEDGRMVLTGSRVYQAGHPLFPGLAGTTAVDIGVWTAHTADSVEQDFFGSTNGSPFVQTFDGRYLRRPSVTPAPSVQFAGCRNRVRNHDLDFTLGEWDVQIDQGALFEPTDKAMHDLGAPEATSEIESALSNCLLEEHFHGRAGYEAHVFTSYDPISLGWVRTHGDNRGIRVLLRDGQLAGGSVVMTGKKPHPDGATADLRVTWTPVSPDMFTQRWESSTDGGATWDMQFTAVYVRRGA